ncbi:hypothetical protein YpMG051020_0738 [Yersinia pestis biovar Orientalis str. MG05-1020]|nr:hypothetical protein YpMG051020_0738 [Yersinia pestis biovar Orientalis str. MG05-1020]
MRLGRVSHRCSALKLSVQNTASQKKLSVKRNCQLKGDNSLR